MLNKQELYEAFFQEGKPYYIEKLENFKAGKKISFNVFVLFFGVFWFL